jgi:septal ring factor EnvC (AmiA/AmiB activator)
MPELYGNPYKWQLRKQISELNQHLRSRNREVMKVEQDRDGWRDLYLEERERGEALAQKLQEVQGNLNDLAASLAAFRERWPPEQQN